MDFSKLYAKRATKPIVLVIRKKKDILQENLGEIAAFLLILVLNIANFILEEKCDLNNCAAGNYTIDSSSLSQTIECDKNAFD